MAVILIGGGARSGKSRFALRRAEESASEGVFLATAEARDEEMRERIARHQAERGRFWTTVEEPLLLPAALEREARRRPAAAIVVDCLTLWLSNVMLDPERDERADLDELIETLRATPSAVLLITNEVGAGIVPENALARRYRDLAGILNQRVAEVADEVYWLVFGCPLRVKPER